MLIPGLDVSGDRRESEACGKWGLIAIDNNFTMLNNNSAHQKFFKFYAAPAHINIATGISLDVLCSPYLLDYYR